MEFVKLQLQAELMNQRYARKKHYRAFTWVADLYLLGYALGTTLTVVRPGQGGNEDYVSRYPEWQVGNWPEAVLVEHEGRYWACAT